MKIQFLWGPRWTQRGFAFCRGGSARNVHYIDLLALRGYTWRIQLLWFFHSWQRTLTLGRY